MSWRPSILTAIAALAATLAVPGTAAADDPPPQVESRAGTEAPAEVSGLAEPARAGDPVQAAKTHLEDPRYHLNPDDLVPLQTITDGADVTVRFAQRHRDLPVFGGQYLVHFADQDGQRVVTGAGGRFHTELSVDPTPTVTAETAGKLARALLTKNRITRESVEAGAGELVVVPRGTGVLAWRIPLKGHDRAAKRPVLRDAYVDARSGAPLFAVDRLHFEGPVQATGQGAHGEQRTLNAYQNAGDAYELRDRARPMWNGATGEILTYDAAGGDVFDYLGSGVPDGTKLAQSPTPAFGPQHTDSGAVDAHWGAGQVYEYYRRLGREGLDGAGGTMHSVVNVTYLGEPFANAFWDGTKMVYGGGGPDFHSFAAALDVVGHEMTHGVITNSADLVYLGQSGAMNEGLADYFGNAIEVDTLGIPMSDPEASLLGEDFCKNATPVECATRDLDDDRNAAEDYLGVTVASDGGGVHSNSTIFSGALWDVREKLGGPATDKVVYKALTEYMTPLDDFEDGRRAVESAARAARLPARDRTTIARAFDRHGIKPGWDRRIATDSRVLIDGLTDAFVKPDVAGDRYVVVDSTFDATGPTVIRTGRVSGGKAVRLSDDDRWNTAPATDGRRAVWVSYDDAQTSFRILSRPLDGRAPATVVHETARLVASVVVSGDDLAWEEVNLDTGEAQVWLKRGTAAPVGVSAVDGAQGLQPSLNRGKLAYLRWKVEGGVPHSTPVLYDLATGTRTVLPEVPATGDGPSASAVPVLTSRHLVWAVDTDNDGTYGIMRAAADGTGATALVPDGPEVGFPIWMDAGDSAVTIGLIPDFTVANNADLPKLFQVPLNGGTLQRYSCNRGEQFLFAAGDGERVVWLDGTAADTDLVTRTRPARRC
ncbi:M4 family metallopeptidase [Nonomuraea glycinis]|uniref:M4 family metallopeptidase n=1 Tax=Nonomuraea glycinis TaxID=2047744 RepID=UPI002E13152F|nr:M4 family metallopeptidase [Nonomuraea glycinis]